MIDSTLTAASPAEERLVQIIRLLREAHPDAKCALDYENPLQLLVATILSAQCTDERVNKVTPVLFARFPTAQALAEADREELEQIIHSTGFYRNKAKNVQEACRRIVAEYGGEVPSYMADLLTLAGVACKTANVVLGNCYGVADGVVVDTHVKRLSERLKLSAQAIFSRKKAPEAARPRRPSYRHQYWEKKAPVSCSVAWRGANFSFDAMITQHSTRAEDH